MLRGLRYPCLEATVDVEALPPAGCTAVITLLEEAGCSVTPPVGVEPATAEWFLALVQQVQEACLLPVYEPGRAKADAAGTWTLFVPCLPSDLRQTASILLVLCRFLDAAVAGRDADAESPKLLAGLLQDRPTSKNRRRFIRAALELDIPFFELAGNAMQFGVGRNSIWMESTYTPETSALSARLARNKLVTSQLLQVAGVPAPSALLVSSEAEAVHRASQLGFPVVIKPADTDGGVGVTTDIRDESGLANAFAKARKFSQQVLLEKHVAGRDYRITVFRGEAIWAIEKQPASITGDGVLTIAELVAKANADPRRGRSAATPLALLALDAEALDLLARQGLGPTSIPAAGTQLRLRSAANVAVGGVPVPVFEEAHPDNLKLAVAAADALRLDLAGIDLLIPDIAWSWQEGGAAVCDVNAAPDLGEITAKHLYPWLLRQLVPNDGRTPVYLVAAEDPADILDAPNKAGLGANGAVGIISAQGRLVEGKAVSGPLRTAAQGLGLRANRQLKAAIILASQPRFLADGIPFGPLTGVYVGGLGPEWSADELTEAFVANQPTLKLTSTTTASAWLVSSNWAGPLRKVGSAAALGRRWRGTLPPQCERGRSTLGYRPHEPPPLLLSSFG